MKFYATLRSLTTIIILTCSAAKQIILPFFTTKKLLITYHESQYMMQQAKIYSNYIHNSASIYGIDEKLVKAIIQVESCYNPSIVSKSHAIGLMQIKASTAGRDAYKLKGMHGEPSILELKDAAINIDIGTAYLGILQKQLSGISNTETRRYALTVAYVNGAGALLRTFSANRNISITKINTMTPQQFYQYVQRNHPAPQAARYLWKVNITYLITK